MSSFNLKLGFLLLVGSLIFLLGSKFYEDEYKPYEIDIPYEYDSGKEIYPDSYEY